MSMCAHCAQPIRRDAPDIAWADQHGNRKCPRNDTGHKPATIPTQRGELQ